MAYKALLHFTSSDPILCEVERIPEPTDLSIRVYNPTLRDGKQIDTIAEGVSSLVYPLSRLTFIEIFDEESRRESIVGVFRESGSFAQ